MIDFSIEISSNNQQSTNQQKYTSRARPRYNKSPSPPCKQRTITNELMRFTPFVTQINPRDHRLRRGFRFDLSVGDTSSNVNRLRLRGNASCSFGLTHENSFIRFVVRSLIATIIQTPLRFSHKKREMNFCC